MATRVTRNQRADGTTEDQESDCIEASAGTTGANVVDSESADTAVQVRMKELGIEGLQLRIELQKLKIHSQTEVEEERSDRSGLARYAVQLREVFSPMPVSSELVPAWFRSAENMFRSCTIYEDVNGAVIVPSLNENSRTLVDKRAEDRVLSHKEVRDPILHGLNLIPEEYKRRLYTCRKVMRHGDSSPRDSRFCLIIVSAVEKEAVFSSCGQCNQLVLPCSFQTESSS
ncbi:hypothetical protein MRX96_043396 [Rhipicephalus microplus]